MNSSVSNYNYDSLDRTVTAPSPVVPAKLLQPAAVRAAQPNKSADRMLVAASNLPNNSLQAKELRGELCILRK